MSPKDDVTWQGKQHYVLERLSLCWHRADISEAFFPGMIPITYAGPNDIPKGVASKVRLTNCFQTYNKEARAEFIGPDSPEAREQLGSVIFNGKIRPPMLDSALPCKWLQHCLAEHKCGLPKESPSSTEALGSEHKSVAYSVNKLHEKPGDEVSKLRFIDVTQHNIVEFRESDLLYQSFAALSYVWGRAQRLILRENNIAELKQPQSLVGKLAKTIVDAIQLTRLLNVQYLWVDSLCIIQDNHTDQSIQIDNMSKIYARALVTIIAASGEHANVGLAGISYPRTKHQVEVPLPETESDNPSSLLTTLNPTPSGFASWLIGCPWASRGWTFQEDELSRRKIIFAEQQVFWSCNKVQWAEETAMDTSLTMSTIAAFPLTADLREDPNRLWNPYFKFLVAQYSGRCLTNAGDAMDAFSAILQQHKSLTGSDFLWGMPTAYFESSLCWGRFEYTTLKRRPGLTTHPVASSKRRVPFPSWSWLGWEGRVAFEASFPFQWDDIPEEEANSTKEARIVSKSEIECYTLRQSPLRLKRVSMSGLSMTATSTLSVSLENILMELPAMTVEQLRDTPDEHYLYFWTDQAFLTTELYQILDQDGRNGVHAEWYPMPERYGKNILNEEGRKIGHCLATEQQPITSMNGASTFILIASQVSTNRYEKQVIAMELEFRGNVSSRVNIAYINESDWNSAVRERKLICLN
ncbi:uncharacterized protein KY384_007315 [Bacidia gigantensis]|uniref:uncharacterized protein n=1 Tax=Bacidia gigantensis TaxID=2732470 RepID=UPI001D04AE77|nr:uncharacterized protein KY384_007315 [Bacidia gigantensis]KAG8528397.1 hypothetical protein KY384_007315 [Bacidia gigantensis]